MTFKAERILQAWRAAICYRLASSGKDLDAAERWCDAGEAEPASLAGPTGAVAQAG